MSCTCLHENVQINFFLSVCLISFQTIFSVISRFYSSCSMWRWPVSIFGFRWMVRCEPFLWRICYKLKFCRATMQNDLFVQKSEQYEILNVHNVNLPQNRRNHLATHFFRANSLDAFGFTGSILN